MPAASTPPTGLAQSRRQITIEAPNSATPLPREAENLIAVTEIKQACVAANIAKLDAGTKGALVTFRNDSFANPEGLLAYAARLGERAKFRPDQKLFVAGDWGYSGAAEGGAGLATGLAKIAGGATVKPAEVKVAAKVARAAPKPMPPRPSVLKAKGRGRALVPLPACWD